MRRLLLLWPGALAVLLLGGCANLGYYASSAAGQMGLWAGARTVEEVLADPDASEELKSQLEFASRVRRFAVEELGLPDRGTFRRYVDLKRSYVVWNVFAAPEFSIEAKEWCFPVAGCVAYKGYFSETDAESFAARLRNEGYDVYVGGVPAYSTLGWFDDPLLNTFLGYPATDLARLIFHELAHLQVYVKGDTVFNESFATAVELEGVTRWLAAEGEAEAEREFEARQRMRSDFRSLVLTYREALGEVYRRGLPEEEARREKQAVFDRMRSAYAELRSGWGYGAYDAWFADLNNAKLASVASYAELVPAFQRLLRGVGGDLGAFYARVGELGKLPAAERQLRLLGAQASSTVP